MANADGTRLYRFPESKPNTPQDLNPTDVQANFETLKDGKRISNGHMGIRSAAYYNWKSKYGGMEAYGAKFAITLEKGKLS